MKRVRRSVEVAVVLAWLLLSACSSSSTSAMSTSPSATSTTASPAGQAAAAYVAGFCKAFAEYVNHAPVPSLGSGSDLERLKRFYVSIFDGEISAAHVLVVKIKALGTPAVPDGAKVSATLIRAFTAAESNSRSLRDAAASLPTSSPEAFNRAVNRLFLQFRQDSTGTALAANPFRSNPELLAAFRSSPECGDHGTSNPSSVPSAVAP